MTVILHNERINPAEQRGARAEHDPVTEQPVERRADAEVHQVFHQDIPGVLGPGKARFTHGESGLHKEDQRGSEKYPDGVGCRECHTDHFRFLVFHPKRKRGGVKHTLAPHGDGRIL